MNRRLRITLALLVAALAVAALVLVTGALAQDNEPELMGPAPVDLEPAPSPIGARTTLEADDDDDDSGFQDASYDVDVGVGSTVDTPATQPTVPVEDTIGVTLDDTALDPSIYDGTQDAPATEPGILLGATPVERTVRPGGPLIENRVRSASLAIVDTSYDLDADGMLDIDEFAYAFDDGWFDDWDLDQDDAIYTDEFGVVAFLQWDLDGNRALDVTEWNALALQVFGDDEVVGTFTDWDLDEDFYVTRDEFTIRLEETGLFRDWDLNGDGLIDRIEFDDVAFGFYDLNGDARVDDDELYLEPWF